MKKRIAAFIAATVVSALSNQFTKLFELGRSILTGQDHLKAAIDTLTSKSVEELTAIKTDITALAGKLGSGTLTDADFEALAGRLDTVSAAIDSVKAAADAANAPAGTTAASQG